ncbi:cytoskeletal protein binding protein [Orbilia brochopaga]|uniref:Actin cytoskeleton-regulatory complex protein SLA1 n=1 Tax=Orbilia brochopaga TaxID=3140254 RepID=A0AAV9UB34_9PEZI
MSFLGVYRAIYDYAPQTDEELALTEGDLLYVLEKSSEDAWWKAKKKAGPTDEEEPVGLIPNTYIEEAAPIGKLRASYDYQRQTEEELSFSEGQLLNVYDLSDPDWSLVGLKDEFGFAPANYLEKVDDAPTPSISSPSEPAPPPLPIRTQPASPPAPEDEPEDEPENPVRPSAAAAVAAALKQRQASIAAQSPPPPPMASPTTTAYTPPPKKEVHFTPEASDDDEPPPRLPERPASDISSPYASPISPRPPTTFEEIEAAGVHRYPIDEIVNKKKIPCLLELGNAKITLRPQKRSIPPTTWEIEDLQTYSADGKHVGLDLVSPIRSLDLRAESKDVAGEIIRDLGEMRGAARAAGLGEIIAAATSSGKRFGIVLYDFEAQGSDEVSVSIGDEVAILNDTQSDEWWSVRRMKNGKEGVVPSSYIELKKRESVIEPLQDAVKGKQRDSRYGHSHKDSVGPGIMLPPRESSLNGPSPVSTVPPPNILTGNTGTRKPTGRTATNDKPKPNAKNVRTWTDRSGTFKVDAEFLNLRDGVIHLHKINGVKIAVPIAKMSKADLEYVERKTGMSLDEDKPLSDLRGKSRAAAAAAASTNAPKPSAGITIDRSKSNGNKDEYDWFEFFLNCGVDVNVCQRYANNFAKDSMDESILPDINQGVLRTLGLKEGDILRVMKYLDNKYGRKKDAENNTTRRERPAPGIQTSDVVDAKMLEQRKPSPDPSKAGESKAAENDPWAPKPSKQETAPEPPKATSPAPQQVAAAPAETQAQPKPQAPPTGALRELSLLDEPLKPTVVTPPVEKPTPVISPPVQPTSAPPQQVYPPPNILAAPLSVYQQPQPQQNPAPAPYLGYQQTGILQNQPTGFQTAPLQAQATARQRPAAPQIVQASGGLAPPPPQRPQSAPGQNFPQQIAPLVPAVTGYGNISSVAPQGQLNLSQLQQQQEFQRQLQAQQAQQALQQQQAALQQQQAAALQPQLTAVPGNFGVPQLNYPGLAVQPTGYPQQQLGYTNPLLPQGTGLGPLPPPFKPTVDLSLPTPLLPQNTAVPAQPQPNGFGGQPGAGPINRHLMPALTPLKPQSTGPAPAVKFGVTPSKLAPQPTGARKANLNAATPENPFGF